MTLITILAWSVTGGVLGWLAAALAAERAAAQPVDFDPSAERELVSLVEAHPELAGEVDPEWLSAPALRERLAAIPGGGAGGVTDRAAMKRFRKLAARVADSHFGRTVLVTARSPIVRSGDPENPWRRVEVAADPTRMALCAAAGAAAGAASSLGVVGGWWGLALFAVYVFGGLVVAIVDLDTYLIDLPVFSVWASASAAVAGLAQGTGVLVEWLLVGGAAAVSFEAVSRIMSAVTGRGQGGGDTLVVAVSAGWATAMAGSVGAGILSVLVASATATAHWVLKSGGRDTPIPFAPHLVLSAFWAVALWQAGGPLLSS